MRLKAPEFVIPEDGDPFANDKLDRKESALILSELLYLAETPLVLCINAPWGDGKTTFLKMWRKHLKDNGFPTVYFSAWESDFSDDALVSLIGELDTGLAELVKADLPAKNALAKVKKLGSGLIKLGIPLAAKLLTGGLLDIKNGIPEFCEKFAEEQIKKYEASKNIVKEFKINLEKLVTELGKVADNKPPLPLVIFIDELDRCRPTYAIEVLEKVKHFFNVSNVIFVLALDKTELGHSIKCLYGHEFGVEGYLRRFIDIDYMFPESNKIDFCTAQFEHFGLNNYFEKRLDANEFSEIHTTMSDLSSLMGCSLREQEHCFSILQLVAQVTAKHQYLYPFMLGFLFVLKVKNPSLYKAFSTRKIDVASILKYMKDFPEGETFLGSKKGAFLEAFLFASITKDHDGDSLRSNYQKIYTDQTKTEKEKDRAILIHKILNSIDDKYSWNFLSHLVKKIDLMEHFKSS